MALGHLLTRSGLTYPEVSSKVCHDSFFQLEKCFIIVGNLLRGIIQEYVQWNNVNLWIGGPKLDFQHGQVFLSRFHSAHTGFGNYPACCTTYIGTPFRGWSAHILWLTPSTHLVVWGRTARRIVGWSPLSYIQDIKRSF